MGRFRGKKAEELCSTRKIITIVIWDTIFKGKILELPARTTPSRNDRIDSQFFKFRMGAGKMGQELHLLINMENTPFLRTPTPEKNGHPIMFYKCSP